LPRDRYLRAVFRPDDGLGGGVGGVGGGGDWPGRLQEIGTGAGFLRGGGGGAGEGESGCARCRRHSLAAIFFFRPDRRGTDQENRGPASLCGVNGFFDGSYYTIGVTRFFASLREFQHEGLEVPPVPLALAYLDPC